MEHVYWGSSIFFFQFMPIFSPSRQIESASVSLKILSPHQPTILLSYGWVLQSWGFFSLFLYRSGYPPRSLYGGLRQTSPTWSGMGGQAWRDHGRGPWVAQTSWSKMVSLSKFLELSKNCSPRPHFQIWPHYRQRSWILSWGSSWTSFELAKSSKTGYIPQSTCTLK